MANERTYPLLPCGNLDESISFYETLGFRKTYRQIRPNPHAVVALEEIQIHLFGMIAKCIPSKTAMIGIASRCKDHKRVSRIVYLPGIYSKNKLEPPSRMINPASAIMM